MSNAQWWNPKYDNIPQELRDKTIWLRWKLTKRNGDDKSTKLPYKANGLGMARTNDPTTWSSFEDAAQHTVGDGLGCVVKDGLVVIDLDKVRDPATGVIERWAQEIIDECASYTEVSPSKTGVHIWLRGEVPAGGNRRGRIEMYDHQSPRYMTITGDTLNGHHAIREYDLTSIHQRMLAGIDPLQVEKAAAKQTDDSAADFSFCRKLAEQGKTAEEIDAAMRTSALMRPKWDSTRPNGTYGTQTIARAMANVHVNTSRMIMETAKTVKPERLDWLWNDKVPFGKLTLFVGNPGMGKSFVSLDIVSRASKGSAWSDCKNTSAPVESIVVSSEDDPADTIVPRLIAMGADLDKVHLVKAIHILDKDVSYDKHFSLDTDLPALKLAMEEHPNVRLIVIDPIANHLGRANINREQEVRDILSPLAKLAAERQAAIILVTHFNKSMGLDTIHKIGGAVAMVGTVRIAWAFVESAENSDQRMMLNAKANLSARNKGMLYSIESVDINTESGAIEAARVQWGGETEADLNETMETNANPEAKKTARATCWLRSYLGDQETHLARDVFTAGEAFNFGDQVIRRAYKALHGLTPKKTTSGWMWQLPVQVQDDSP